MSDTSVKYFHSGMAGAPVLNGVVGSAVGILKACLTTGWGLKSVDSLVVVDGVATANISGGHSAERDCVVLIAGTPSSALNAEWRVKSTSVSTVVFETPGIPDQTIAGGATLKIAPAGWANPYSGANIEVFQQVSPESSGMFLRVDDTATGAAALRAYESMTGLDAGVDPFPQSSQRAGGVWWQKSNQASTVARDWFLVADAGAVYFGRCYTTFYAAFEVGFFGTIAARKSPDPYACFLFGMESSATSTPELASQLCYSDRAQGNKLWGARSYTGIGGAVGASKMSTPLWPGDGSGAWLSGLDSGPAYPNPADGALYFSPHNIYEGGGTSVTSPSALRGAFPGFYTCPQNIPNGTFTAPTKLRDGQALPGRVVLAVTSYADSSPRFQTSFIDITGPWR